MSSPVAHTITLTADDIKNFVMTKDEITTALLNGYPLVVRNYWGSELETEEEANRRKHREDVKKSKDGTLVYRLWSTNSDQYLTEDMTLLQAFQMIASEAIDNARDRLFRDIASIGDRIERAEKMGTSCMISGPGNTGPMTEWKKELNK